MKKIFILFAVLAASTTIWARNNEIAYTATEKLEDQFKYYHFSGPNSSQIQVIFHDYAPGLGTGFATFNLPVVKIGSSAFYRCSALTSITLPASLTTIGSSAFSNCTALTSITLPASITTIGTNAFCLCSTLTTVTCLSTTPPGIGTDVFLNCPESLVIYVPYGCGDDYKTAWSAYANHIVAITLDMIKEEALAEIQAKASTANSAIDESSLPAEDKAYFKALVNSKVESAEATIDEATSPDVITAARDTAIAEIQSIIVSFNLAVIKANAIAAINTAMANVTNLTQEESDAIENHISVINSTTDEDTINTEKDAALSIINSARIRGERESAIATINEALQGISSEYLMGLLVTYFNTINCTTISHDIEVTRDAAIELLSIVVPAYIGGMTEAYGTMGEPQNGPAIEVTKGDKSVKLYQPEKVEFIMVNEDE